jgi:hypothetical protein
MALDATPMATRRSGQAEWWTPSKWNDSDPLISQISAINSAIDRGGKAHTLSKGMSRPFRFVPEEYTHWADSYGQEITVAEITIWTVFGMFLLKPTRYA